MKIKYLKVFVASIILIEILVSCSKIDAFKKYANGGEITYTGKIDSVRVEFGYHRVKFSAILNSDPRVVYYRVYWGNKSDSVTFNVSSTSGDRYITQMIEGLEEGSYSFEFITFDKNGNSSVPTYKNGTVYGDNFISNLSNRKLYGSALNGNFETAFNFVDVDTTTGIVGTEIRYLKNTGDSGKLYFPYSLKDVTLPDFKYGTPVIYRSYYLPDTLAFDTLKTAYTAYQPISGSGWKDATLLFSNPGPDFKTTSSTSRWGVIANWTTNSAISAYSYELRGGIGVMSFEAGWGLPAALNGKTYQKIYLPKAGDWKFTANVGVAGTSGQVFMVVSNNALPDVADINTSIKYLDISTVANESRTLDFDIATADYYYIGFVCYLPGNGEYHKINSVTLSYNLK